MNLAGVRELLAYDEWANRRLCQALAALTPEELTRPLVSSFPSVLHTLAHIVAEEWIWLERAKGANPRSVPAWATSGASLAELENRLRQIQADRSGFLDALSDADLVKELAFDSLEGHPCRNRVGSLLVHVAHHSTYHRGQIATLLRQLGRAAPETDFVVFAEG